MFLKFLLDETERERVYRDNRSLPRENLEEILEAIFCAS